MKISGCNFSNSLVSLDVQKWSFSKKALTTITGIGTITAGAIITAAFPFSAALFIGGAVAATGLLITAIGTYSFFNYHVSNQKTIDNNNYNVNTIKEKVNNYYDLIKDDNINDLDELTSEFKKISEAASNICDHTIETRCKGILVMRKLNELNEKQLTPPEGNNPHKFSFCFMSDDDYKAFNNVKTINGQVPRHSKLGYVLAYPDNIISTAKETGLFVP